MAQDWISSRPCRNCGTPHVIIPGEYSLDCNYIAIRSHRDRGASKCVNHCRSSVETRRFPSNMKERTILFDEIFFWFHNQKAENDCVRESVAARYRQKGVLKTKAPLPWLQWKRFDGAHGQTRNQENWDRIWSSFDHCVLDSGEVQPIAWLTINPNTREERIPLPEAWEESQSSRMDSISSPTPSTASTYSSDSFESSCCMSSSYMSSPPVWLP